MIAIILPVYSERLSFVQARLELLLADDDIAAVIISIVESDPDYQKLLLLDAIERVQVVAVKKPARAIQMNAGAAICEEKYLIFLHADTQLPDTAAKLVIKSLKTNLSGWGRFDVKLDCDRWIYRVIAKMMNWRSRVTQISTGDQALFVRRDFFLRIGGFKVLPLMEDIEFCRRAKRVSVPICLSQKVVTSARRWQHGGVIKTISLMWLLRFLYWLGVSPDRLAQYYRAVR